MPNSCFSDLSDSLNSLNSMFKNLLGLKKTPMKETLNSTDEIASTFTCIPSAAAETRGGGGVGVYLRGFTPPVNRMIDRQV